ncbi:hypothetical protein SAMN05444280_13334 [Tangfeifania diversioriginum]|uniref:Uncharacterized protein n=1 Tax=Tangfeifania diversioriginum TaxID=1168035 RepID=A0A1M6MJ78_9BACT|nr:hypothetical protein [Tangfeifania diversioriginum]SHJ83541.1 hypothetical protein SAMN05444280_13334 [Tangfeifania diversioriginum]
MTETAKKIRKISGLILTTTALLVVVAAIVVWILLPGFANKKLTKFVTEKSGGNYHLSIQKIERKYWPFSIKFHEVSFVPDEDFSAKAVQDSTGKTTYSVRAKSIEFEGIKFRKLLRNKAFLCRKVSVEKPEVSLAGDELAQSNSEQMAEMILAQTRPFISNYLNEINIRQIEFTDASFGLYGPAGDSALVSGTDQVSLEVLGFHTDTAMIFHQTHFFKTDDVLVKITDFNNEMGDSLHFVNIDTLAYSLKSTDIRAVGFRLAPLYRNTAKNLYEVDVPEVYVKSRSITHFALNDSLKISFLEFKNPNIRFFQKENPDRLNLEDLNRFDLYTLIQNQFTKMEVDSFQLTSARLEIFRQPDYTSYQQQFGAIDITLNGFALDSTSAQNTEKLLHSDEIEMRVSDYYLRLEDNQHDFRADSLVVSTYSDQLGAYNIKISPGIQQEMQSRTEVNIACEALNIENVNLRNLYHTRSLPTSKIEIQKPDVQLKYHIDREKQKKQEETGLLYELVTDYLEGVYSNLAYIDKGKLNIENHRNEKLEGYFETDFTFSLTDFSLDSTSRQRTDKFFFATNFDLHFSDYEMQLVDDLHKLEIGQATISSTNQHVQIENLKLQPVINNVSITTMEQYNRSELYNISIPEISLNNVRLNDAFFNKKLKIDHFKISTPKIYFENFGTLRKTGETTDFTEFYQLVFNYIEDFDINKFSAPNGKLTWVNHTRNGKTISFDNEFSASLDKFRLNKNEIGKQRLFFSDNFDVTIKDQQFELSDSVHILKAGEIRLSSANSLVSVKDALLYPGITTENYHELATTFQVAIPELIISDFNFPEAYYSRQPNIELLELVSPRFQVYRQTDKAKPLDLNKYQFPLPAFLQSLHLNELKISDANVVTYATKGIDHRAVANFSFSLSMPGLVLENNEQQQAQILSSNILLNISDFKAPLGEDHNFSAGSLNFNRDLKTISIGNLQIDPFMTGPGNNRFSISAPKIEFTGFDLATALKQSNFNFEKIDIQTPSVDIEINKQIQNDTIEFLQTLDLYPYVEPLLNQIKVNNLSLTNAELNLNWLKKELFNNKINLSFNDILIAENQPPSNFLNSAAFEISTTGLQTKSNDNRYRFSAGSLTYNSSRHQVLLTNLAIEPLIDKEKFPKKDGYQTDVVQATIDFAQLQGINERRWLNDNILDAEMLKIGPARLNIYRNKRYPFNQQQRPPWPQDLIKNIRQPFVFDSIVLMPSHIRYSELLGTSDEPGFVDFGNLTLNGGQFTNIAEVLQQHNNFIIDARAELYNQSTLSARFNFDMTSHDYYHTVKGSLAPMPLTPINKMLGRASPMIIETGNLNRLEFKLELNATNSSGLLYMGYNDLKIAVMEYNSSEQGKAGFASFWANKMILNSQNPKKGELEPAPIYYERDIKRSIINYWWKSIYSGTKKVLGIEPKK